jgi:hypothetical protein
MTTTQATAERIGKVAAIDPIVAVAIITALVQLVTLCMTAPTPEDVVEAAKNPTRLQRFRMRLTAYREMRKNGIPRRDRGKVWLAVSGEMAAMTPEDARSICLDCQATADYGD